MNDQPGFRAALLDPSLAVPDGLIDSHGAPAGARFSVYRNNVAVSLTEALQVGFPVLQKLIGAENFKQLAALFLRAHPPTSPLMMHYGDQMPAFLEVFEPLKKLPYLADVARLELALRASYHAADSTPISPATLEQITPDALLAATFEFAPAMRLVRSRWPIHGIWLYNMKEGAQPPENKGENTLVIRTEFDPEILLLPAGGGLFLSEMMQGATLGTAVDVTTLAAPDFDLGFMLGLLIQNGLLTSIDTTQ